MTSKPKLARVAAAQAQQTGAYKVDSVRDAAESIGISNLPDSVASILASDIEYRIHQVLEEAARFMRHGRRTTLTTSDIDQALRVLNIEPLYGHTSHNPPTFRRALPLSSTGAGSSSLGAQSSIGGLAGILGASGSLGGAGVNGLSSAGGAGGANNSQQSAVYFIEDEEIDFDRVIRDEKIVLPRGVNWTAHWLAVEGVQPLIPENPPAIVRETAEEAIVGGSRLLNGLGGVGGARSTPGVTTNGTAGQQTQQTQTQQAAQQQQQQQQQLVKQVLSRELQLYYARLTSSLLPTPPASNAVGAAPSASDVMKRTAAIASLRHDAGLQALLPYLIRWVGEGVVSSLKEGGQGEHEGRTMQVYLDVISALLDNKTLFVEPYLHQLLPPLLSLLLHSTLPLSHSAQIRTTASSTLSHLLRQHSTTYPSLSPRIMKTLLLALVAPGKTFGTREGAVRGLVGVGKEAIRKGLVEGGGARVIGVECAGAVMNGAVNREAGSLVSCVLDALATLYPRSDMPESLDPEGQEDDKKLWVQLREVLGPEFASRVEVDRDWARGVVWGEVASQR